MKFAAKLFLLYEKSVQHKKACEAGTKENKTKGFFKEEKIMVVVLKPDTKEEQIENLKVWLSSMGISTHISRGVNHTIVGLVGDTSVVDMDLVRALDIVENVQRIQEPFKNANRKFHNADQVVDIAGVKIGGGNFQIIAGPCSVESRCRSAAWRRIQAQNLPLRIPGSEGRWSEAAGRSKAADRSAHRFRNHECGTHPHV